MVQRLDADGGGMHGMRGRIGEQHMGGRTGVLGGSAKIMAPLACRGKASGGSDELVTGRSHGLRHELSPIHGGGGDYEASTAATHDGERGQARATVA